MADLFRSCQDGHRCENNAICAESMEGSYFCDCATASGDFVGLSCEFQADVYCRAPSETTATWFCANQGTCSRSLTSWRCECPPEYDGPHCEYIKGAKPSDWPGTNTISRGSSRGGGDEGLEVGIMVTIILVSLIVVALLGFMVLRSIRKRKSMDGIEEEMPSFRKAGKNAPKDQSEALNIDMDGSGIREAVMSSGTKYTDGFTFDSAGVDLDPEVESPRASNGGGAGNHSPANRDTWGGQML